MGRELARLMAELRNLGYAPLHPLQDAEGKGLCQGNVCALDPGDS